MKINPRYKPSAIDVIFDVMILILGVFVVLRWFPFTTNTPFQKYLVPAVVYLLTWTLSSYFFGRYLPLHQQKYLKTNLKLFYTSWVVFGLLWLISLVFFKGSYSVYVIFTFTTIVFGINFAFYILYFAILYAVEYDVTPQTPQKRENSVYKPKPDLDEEAYNTLSNTILAYRGQKILNVLAEKANISNSGTLVMFASNYFDLNAKPNYKYSTIINLELLNNIRGINKLFSLVNNKLPDEGLFVCLFESKSTRKMRLLKKLPKGFKFIVYSLDFIFRRIIPKIFITRRLYYDITKGKKRILSKTEVLGRLYFCGFEVVEDKKVDHLNLVIARRYKQPDVLEKKTYGPFIRLRRVGKNGKKFNVYKMRTMHPYSEYLQAYIYERNNLKEGGKFNKDIRITTLGKFMRKYWLDELPMIFNLINGDMKLVGVRPLSAHYFNLYSVELQELRTKFKPGLLPPFYADMPKTLDEIQESEMKYLELCNKNGVFFTDIKYFYLILRNIFFRKARSA